MTGRIKFLFQSILLLLCISNTCFAEQTDLVKMIPSVILQLPEDENAILVEKNTQSLFVYTYRKNQLVPVFQVPCSTGEIGGVKQKAGDKKTPEGIYFLKDEYEDRELTPIYGKKAFPTDYPNLLDRRRGKNGSAIWIHGTNKKLVPMDSNGCVALRNEDILKLTDFITLNSTPVIMVDRLEKIQTGSQDFLIKQILSVLEQWTQALENGTYHQYLSYYSPEYLPDISWWESWLDLKNKISESGIDIGIEPQNTGIYFHEDVFVALFDNFLTAGNERIPLGKQKLFLRKDTDGFKIVGDEFQNIPKNLKADEGVLISAMKSVVTPQRQEKIILATLDQWLKSWSAKDMDKYASFYEHGFFSDGMNKKAWVQRKKKLAKIYDYIRVSGKDFIVNKTGNDYEVVFFQEYESSGLITAGTKRLKLVNKGGLWKISQESWKEK